MENEKLVVLFLGLACVIIIPVFAYEYIWKITQVRSGAIPPTPYAKVHAFTGPSLLNNIDVAFRIDPVREHCFRDWDWRELSEGTMPFNVDMIDAENVSYDGEGIYVAILDTGILTDWMNFFPPDTVEIDWSLAKGFTHDYYFNTTLDDFVLGPLRDDRGPFTHDLLNPTPVIGPDNVFYGYLNSSYYLNYPAVGPSGWGSGHGTHVQSIITGWKLNRTDLNTGEHKEFWVRGVAPNVTVIPLLVSDDWVFFDDEWNVYFDHGGTDEMVAAGINYIGDLADEFGIKIIINISISGHWLKSPMTEDAIDYAISKGVIIIASAGSQGYSGMGWPGAYPQVISVAAAGWTQEFLPYYTGEPDAWYWWTNDVSENFWTEDPLGNEFQLYLTDFSSRPNPELGQETCHLDVAAPGAAVRGPYKDLGPTLSDYICVWGTTVAAPHVAGIAALVLDKCPTIEQERMEDILKSAGYLHRLTKIFENNRSATIFDVFAWPDYPEDFLVEQTWLREDYGTGLVQADAALEYTLSVSEMVDLSISSPDIVFSDSNPSEGQVVTLSATIHNVGQRNAKNITVLFVDANTLIGKQQISFISHGSHGTTSVEWTAEGEGFHLIKVVVDPDNIIVEADEANNEAIRSILVGEIPFFGGIVVNGLVVPNETLAGDTVNVYGNAWYNTTYGAGEPVAGADVTITVIGETQQELTYTIADGTYTVDINAPNSPGNYTIAVTVTDFTFWESIEIPLNVIQEEGIDLTLSHHNILFAPSDPTENQNTNITATIHNVGTENATNILVAFYDNSKSIGNRIIDSISAGGSEDVTLCWNATSWGWQTIAIVIDPEDTISELNENNNEAHKDIYVYPALPDLTPTSFDFSDGSPLVNQTITISANVRNIGGMNASNILVSFYDDGEPIGNTTIPRIPGKGGSGMASINHTFTTAESHVICVFVDSDNGTFEADEENNWHCTDLPVHLSLPDLTLSRSNITFSDNNPITGDTITIYAEIHNIGEEDAYNVTVCFYDEGEMLNCTTVPVVNASGMETIEMFWNAAPVGWHRIKVVVDGNNTILESDENNNVATRYIYVSPEDAADLCIHSEDIVFSNTNPAPGENVTFYAIIHNIGEAEAQNVTVRFYVDDVQLGSPKHAPSIPVGENTTVTTSWIASEAGSHVVKVIADAPLEFDKSNNNATKGILIGKHDVAVTDVAPLENAVEQGHVTTIMVTVENEGHFTESFNVTAYANATSIGYATVTNLESGAIETLDFKWNTTDFASGNYTISAIADVVANETDVFDNTFIDSTVTITTLGLYDVALVNVSCSKTVVCKGFSMNIDITVENQGGFTEAFNVTVCADLDIAIIGDEITIEIQNVTLASGNSTIITFIWDTTDIPYGNYTITAKVTPLPYETNTADNNKTDGWVVVTIPGDINGDKVVDSTDQGILGIAWGSIIGEPNYIPEADLNGDGVVDSVDLGILGVNWGHSWS